MTSFKSTHRRVRRTGRLARRGFLTSLLGGAGALAASQLLPAFRPTPAHAGANVTDSPPILLICNFEGGWDTLLCLDPRDNQQYGASAAITPAYQDHASLSGVLAGNGSGLVQPVGSNIVFGPAIGDLSRHFSDLAVIRGVNMGTLTHEVGMRYLLTGKFPSGLTASGSSLTTWAASEVGDQTSVPNLVSGMETYNEGLETFATGLQVNSADDLQLVLKRLGTPLSGASKAAVDDYLAEQRCWDVALDGDNVVTNFNSARSKASVLADAGLASHFDFSATPSPGIAELYKHFGIPTSNGSQANEMQFSRAISGPAGQAALAAQAITNGISQAVSVRLAGGLDHHDDGYTDDHANGLMEGFKALAQLIDWLKTNMGADGQSYWSRTTLLVTSEFARTPKVNGRGGRDHHLANAVMVAGPGLVGNLSIGGTDDTTYGVRPMDLATGLVNDSGSIVRPPDVHATLLRSMGLSYDHLSNQDPLLITKLLA